MVESFWTESVTEAWSTPVRARLKMRGRIFMRAEMNATEFQPVTR
jgi:hypothetical protein